MMPAEKYSYLSSRLVREVAQLGGAIDCLVPELVAQKLREKIDVAHKFENRERAASKTSAAEKSRVTKKRSKS
jgi:pantetheine-phosphate adenylyltransferase